MSSKLANAFLDKLQRSGLVSGDKMLHLQQDLEERGVGLEDPYAIAEALVDNDTISRWQADKLLEGKHRGFFLASYRLLRPLGKGGMGAVFLARHEMMRRQCALKVLPHTSAREGTSVLERFYVEAQAVAALDHPNIVRAYDVNKEKKDNKEVHYLVMEFVDGQDVQVLVNERGPLDYITAADYIRQTANGLAHAHENRLVHRDIKPANLLVDTKGVVKILDLGLARLTHDDSEQASLTAAYNETVLGTADYLSPEQALNSHDVDHRTDIYSLGCTAYFMLTGHAPFPEGTVAQRLVAHQVKTPDPISEERPDAPGDLVAIVEQMMAKDANDRYPTATDVAVALSAWLLQHGGEDWKRQHSEIMGDSALMKILSQREPTRAMRSPTSETELELAPIDEEDKRSSGKPGSAAASRSSAEEISLALDEEEDAAAAVAEEQVSPAEELQELDSLDTEAPTPDLSDEGGLSSLDEAELLGSLDSLESEDLLDVADMEDPLGAIQSDLQLPATAGPGSSTGHRRVAAAQPHSLADSIKAVGMPVVVGVVGGLLVVLIIILLILFGPTSGPEPALRTYVPPDSVTQVPEKPSAEPPQKPTVEPAEQPASAEAPKKSAEGPSKPDKKPTTQTESEKPKPSTTQAKPGQKKPGKKNGKKRNGGKATKPPEPSAPAVKPTRAKAAVTETKPPQTAPPQTAPPTTPPPAATPKTATSVDEELRRMFAGIKEVSVSLPPERTNTKSQSKQRDWRAVFDYGLRMIVISKFSTAAGRLGLSVAETDDAVLEVRWDLKEDGDYYVVDMHGDLKCRAADSKSYSVWTHEQEIFRVKPTARVKIEDLLKDGVEDFFKPFQREYRNAIK